MIFLIQILIFDNFVPTPASQNASNLLSIFLISTLLLGVGIGTGVGIGYGVWGNSGSIIKCKAESLFLYGYHLISRYTVGLFGPQVALYKAS